MTHDEWRQAERVLTQALLLPEGERLGLIDTADLDDELRRKIRDVLGRWEGTGSSRTPTRPVEPRPVGLNPGDTIDGGRFVVVRQIGRGGMGTVYLAHDTTLGTLVALKVLPSDDALIAEARRTAVCSDHPHVATVHNVLRTEVRGTPLGVLVMEYVPGTPATQLIDDGPIDVRRVLRWGQQIAAAIAHAHDRQVLHCDLKPGNVIITPDDAAKVLDFGIARATFDPDAAGGPLRGTLPYMAPEQLEGRFSPAGDIYGLGVTLYELITGTRPFAGEGAELRLRIMMAPPPRVSASAPHVPRELDAVFERALAKNPEDRYRSARALGRALEDVERRVRDRKTVAGGISAAVEVLSDRRAHLSAGMAVLLVGGVLALGALTSAAYNITLERGAFANDTLSDWLLWGRRTSVPPFIAFLMFVAVAAPLVVARRVLLSTSDAVRRIDTSMVERLRPMHRRLRLDDISVLASYALLLSGIALVGAVWYYGPLIIALLDFVSRAPAERLALLAADQVTHHNYYRGAFTFVATLTVGLWFPVIRLAVQGQRLHWGMWAAGGAVLLTTLLFLHFPYKLLNYRNSYEAVSWGNTRCFVTGERSDELLLFCPEMASNRVQKVQKTDPRLKHLGVTETNLFNTFGNRQSANHGS